MPADGRALDLVDPSTGEVCGRVALCGPAEVDAAARAARDAFATWRKSTPAQRMTALLAIADELEARAEEFADAECRETGKPRALVLADEIPQSADALRFFAGAARTPEGRATGEYLPGLTSSIRREPLGVCAQITPWNYPLMMAVWKIGPAVAAGDTTVLKPAETTPTTTVLLAEVCARHLPAGVVNVVTGDRDTGRALVEHEVPAMVSITGSTRAGAEVAKSAASALKRTHLELGGNAPVLVFADADPVATAAAVADAAFYNAGQDCTAASRVLVHRDLHEAFTDALAERAHAARTGLAPEDGGDFGPLNSAAQLTRVLGLLERLPAHATVRAGGSRVGDRGFHLAATVVDGVRQDDEIVQEEIFAPVVTVQTFADEAEAVALANGVPQGLAASVWTADHGRAVRLSADLDFGCVWLNAHGPLAAEMPHGGFKQSGHGKDLSAYSLEDYTRVKHVMTAHGTP
ncbi:aminobutyraldehyde dehydrogenase [Actinocorallia sp. A-T 12471]|uniref:aminobutyraldehyde dehydrogenase n=1 Tax=Actinocorallia sp. A-T 12471 TaxID=3089813 RepID=UPI0029CC933A|nr:aminobutyraldehyde dehydrogenase [Actinocorallia sp. A-T 12471]MDX6739595.1 aminobutyraldehyde dehydrogenase [Actinocorallia sp. A-T 12471]